MAYTDILKKLGATEDQLSSGIRKLIKQLTTVNSDIAILNDQLQATSSARKKSSLQKYIDNANAQGAALEDQIGKSIEKYWPNKEKFKQASQVMAAGRKNKQVAHPAPPPAPDPVNDPPPGPDPDPAPDPDPDPDPKGGKVVPITKPTPMKKTATDPDPPPKKGGWAAWLIGGIVVVGAAALGITLYNRSRE